MPGINQLPAGSEGIAALVLIYSSISWICSCLLIWVAGLYREASSYISLLSYFTLISNTASIVQQAHDITYYQDIVTEQFERRTSYLVNPDLAIANGSFGFDLGLYYIQYYAYNVEAMLVMAFELAQSIYGLSAKPQLKKVLARINATGKVVAIVFPAITISLLRAPPVRKVFVAFMLLADLPLMVVLALSSSTMIAILVRYVQSRKKFTHWTPAGNGPASRTGGTVQSTITSQTDSKTKRTVGLYDRWLMVRFTIAFVVLAAFEVTNTLFQLQSISNNKADLEATAPDLSVGRAKTTLFLFMPGVTAGIFVFLVFGTTAGCRTAMKDLFMFKCLRSLHWSSGRRGTVQTAQGIPGGSSFAHESINKEQYRVSQYPDVMKPLPTAPPGGTYKVSVSSNTWATDRPRSRSQSRRNSQSLRFSGYAGSLSDDGDTIKLRDMKSLDQIHEEYYRRSAEHSDDSGPILPVTRHDGRMVSRGAINIAGAFRDNRER
ncbi:hypothetical protein BX600DRAFT_516840 [Xylariales sp. PMI_506]|nr:hypothetical protein BX600DRAFT_516840 [Xylariales sp. PMI_506]